MREKVFGHEAARSSSDSADVRPARRVPAAVRWLSGTVVLLGGLWLSYEFAMVAIDLGGADEGLPWERFHHVRRPLMTSVLYGLLAVAGFRSIMRWRPWTWWLALAAPLPACAAGVVLDWV